MGSKTLGPPSNVNPFISPKYTADCWRNLNLSTPTSVDWATAVDIFTDRLHGRFLAPVEAIINHADSTIKEFSGFTIIAIDCLLIETLNQFYEGTNGTKGSGEDAFWKFFHGSKYFQNEFDTKPKATIFYQQFRCGILHQAQTKKLSKIRIDMPVMVQASNPDDIEKGLIVDRGRFHEAMLAEIDDYEKKLRDPQNEQDRELRENFIKKMDYICSYSRPPRRAQPRTG